MVGFRYTGTIPDIQKAEKDMMPLLWEGFARVSHNSLRNGHIGPHQLCANSFVVRRYHIDRPLKDDLAFEIKVVFIYRMSANQGQIRMSERDAQRLYPMLGG